MQILYGSGRRTRDSARRSIAEGCRCKFYTDREDALGILLAVVWLRAVHANPIGIGKTHSGFGSP